MALPPAKNPDIALLFRLRRYFIPFLFPAAALLVLALFQANLTLAATSAGQRLLDHFLHTAPSQSGEQIDGAFRSDELRGALEMVGWLVAAAIVAVGAGQSRSVIHEKFTLRLQREIIESLVHEDGETRASRQSGSTLRTYVSDAPSLSAFLIFGIIGIGEHLVRLGTYLVGLIAIPGGWKIVLVVGGLGFLFQTVVVKAFANAERKTGVSADQLKENLFNKASRYFELLERLIFFGGEKAIAREISEQAQQGAKIRRKSLLLASSREAISGILITISLPLTVLLLLGSPGFSPGSVVQAQMLTNLFLLSIVALCAVPTTLRQFLPSLQRIDALVQIPRGPLPSAAVDRLASESGGIWIDEQEVTDWPILWRRRLIGYLPTGFGFLDGTLEQNVLFGRERQAIGDLRSALDLSGVTDFMQEQGIDLTYKIRSLTGEGFLSFGQRRRLGLAQLLCGTHRLVIIDEPGASLDFQSMQKVARNLRWALAGRTAIVITHDPDVFETDFNLFFDEGGIADVGPHEDLLLRNAQYAELIRTTVTERAATKVIGD